MLTVRALNRASLSRQLLLDRARLPVTEAVARLYGLQAQTPHSWYVGLWSRLAGFRAEEAAEALTGRDLVRIAVMRSTIHLLTVDGALTLRPTVQPVLERDLYGNHVRAAARQIDVAAVAAAARELLDDTPMTAKELGAALAPRWPGCPPATLAYTARCLLPLVQVPPRGVWGRSGPIAHTTIEAWTGGEPHQPSPEEMIRGYLSAFGPSTVKDVQTWSGLTRLKEVVDRMRPRLVTFRDESGRELFDLPDAPRPGEDVAAPPRFLYDYDNLLLSYADRSRVVTDDVKRQRYDPHGPVPQLLLVDGFTAGDWRLAKHEDGALLTVRPFRRLTSAERAEVTSEAAGLLEFLQPGAAHDVRITAPV